jgi:hypothetical protein
MSVDPVSISIARSCTEKPTSASQAVVPERFSRFEVPWFNQGRVIQDRVEHAQTQDMRRSASGDAPIVPFGLFSEA